MRRICQPNIDFYIYNHQERVNSFSFSGKSYECLFEYCPLIFRGILALIIYTKESNFIDFRMWDFFYFCLSLILCFSFYFLLFFFWQMKIDVDVQIFLRKIPKFSSKILANTAMKHPFVSFTLLFILLRIFPSLYKSDEKNNDGSSIVGRNEKMMMIHKTMWRTKLLFPRPASIIVDKEECPKEIWEVEVDSSSSKSLKPEFINGSYEIGTSEDSEDEKGAGEAGNKAMEWTTDDQKNLMDLGTPEIERNKRLESLIASQKARKLFSLQVRRTLRNMGSKIPWLKLLIFQYQKAIFFRIRVVNVHQVRAQLLLF